MEISNFLLILRAEKSNQISNAAVLLPSDYLEHLSLSDRFVLFPAFVRRLLVRKLVLTELLALSKINLCRSVKTCPFSGEPGKVLPKLQAIESVAIEI